jgi:peptidase M28-like protein
MLAREVPVRRLPLPVPVLLVVSAGCSSVVHRPEVAALVAQVDEGRLREHVEALGRIGPRPRGEEAATRETVAYLTRTLSAMGYRVREEPFETGSAGVFVAQVRPSADPSTAPQERVLPGDLANAGPLAIGAATARMKAEGLDVIGYTLRAAPKGPPLVVPNILAERKGTLEPERVIEIGAHYDTVPYSPGADDNSSGVAAVLEVARVLADSRPRKTIRFCFFGSEEVRLLGSAAHVEAIRREASPVVEGLLNLDGVGVATDASDSQQAPIRIPLITWLPSTGNFIAVVGNGSSGWLGNLFEDAADVYVPELPYYSANRLGGMLEVSRHSDHAKYWDAGYPAILLSDTSAMRHDRYHQPSDTPDTLNYAFLRQVAQASAATLLEWADR